MPSRRDVLATASSIALLGLAGCSARGGSGANARFRPDVELVPKDATLVARSETRADKPSGALQGEASAYTHPQSERLTVVTEYAVDATVPADGDWHNVGFEAVHDWTTGVASPDGAVSWDSNLEYTDETGATVDLTNESSTVAGRWRIALTEPERSVRYRFRTHAEVTADLSEGDLLLDTNGRAEMAEQSRPGSGESLELRQELQYGEI